MNLTRRNMNKLTSIFIGFLLVIGFTTSSYSRDQIKIVGSSTVYPYATVVAENICRQLEQRMPFRRLAKQAIQKAVEAGAKGAKVLISGRLGGADMARSEFFTEGSVPLQTLRSDISYCADRAETTFGTLGVKVWINNGEVFKAKKEIVSEEA